ncbi:MAG: hypothetical protein C0506_00860 [Anaerolinea sp.]|nr:hypothetical protein [Anaerolinea sp.]
MVRSKSPVLTMVPRATARKRPSLGPAVAYFKQDCGASRDIASAAPAPGFSSRQIRSSVTVNDCLPTRLLPVAEPASPHAKALPST